MACLLTDLKVTKVSFVKRGANKRQFFLAKSADFVEEGAVKPINKPGGAKMRPEIKVKLGEILKKERDAESICALLKEDAVLKVTDEELSEVKDFVGLIPPLQKVEPAPEAALLAKAQADAKKAEEDNRSLQARLAKIEEDNHNKTVSEWVEKECPYLNMTTADAASQIVKAEKVDPETAESLKKSFKSTSDALRISQLTKELGRNGEEGLDPVGGNVVAEVVKKTQELKKGSDAKSSDIIMAAIKDVGAARYENYRKEFNRRARTY
jgi:hypothetical protein